MFIATYKHIRKSNTVPFYFDGNAETVDLVHKVAAATQAAAGFLGMDSTMSDDFLTNTVSVRWVDQAAHDAYELANKDMLDDYRASRIAYEASEGGVTTTEFSTT